VRANRCAGHSRAYYDRAPGACAFLMGSCDEFDFSLSVGTFAAGGSLLGLSGMTLAAAAPRSPTGDDSDAKTSARSSRRVDSLSARRTPGHAGVDHHRRSCHRLPGRGGPSRSCTSRIRWTTIAPLPKEDRVGPPPPQPPEASMSYVAYFKGDKEDTHRRSHFCSTEARGHRPCGCTWERSDPSGW